MKKIIYTCICTLFIFFSCKDSNTIKTAKQKSQQVALKQFVLKGTLSNYLSDKIYLNKMIENVLYPIDSSKIIDNEFKFEGIVEYPERFALSFENYSASIVLIVENVNFEIKITSNSLENPIFKDSPLNDLMEKYKQGGKNIFKKIEYLYPKFQKARLENNAEKLTQIGEEMKAIEQEFQDYTYNFIETNKNSFVSLMILRDQLKYESIDSARIKSTYKSLPDHLKNAPDAQIIEMTLNLH